MFKISYLLMFLNIFVSDLNTIIHFYCKLYADLNKILI